MRPLPIIIAVLLIFGLRILVNYIFDPTRHTGPWYKVRIPEGWEKEVKKDEILIKSPEVDFFTNAPEAIFSIYTHKYENPIFMEDLFEQIMKEYGKMKGRVLDKGEIKIDGQVAKWVLYQNNNPNLIILSFFTIDDFNRFTRLQFTTTPQGFETYREVFETFKGSLRLKKMP